MKMHQLEQLPAEFRSAALHAIANASKIGSPVPVVEVIREVYRDEFLVPFSSVNADDAVTYILWLLTHRAYCGRLGRFRTGWTEMVQLASKLEDPT